MVKLNKLFAMLIAVLGVGTLSAQTWTASSVSAGTFYLYNVGADQFLCSGNNWGSHASVAKGGIPLTLAGSDNVYTISPASIYKDKYLSEVWMDGGSYNWTFEEVSNGVYKIKNGDNVLFWNGGTSTNTTLGADPGTTASQWQLVAEENRVAALSDATQGNPIDATFLIKNAYFAKGNGSYIAFNSSNISLTNSTSWKGTSLTNFWGFDSGNEDACYAVEQYGKTFDNYQELTVPNGKYFVTAKGFYRGNVVPYIYANDQKCDLKVKGDIGGDNIANGAKALVGDDYLLAGVTVVVTNGSLKVGVKSDAGIDWCMFDDFKLVYYGKDLTTYENVLGEAITTAEGIDQTELNNPVKNILNEAIANAKAAKTDAGRTVESLEKAAADLIETTNLVNNIASIYVKVNALVETCNGYATNSTPTTAEDLTTFSAVITKTTTDKENATTVEALNTVYSTLEAARQVYVVNAIPTNSTTFDLTFKVVNPTFDVNTNGWLNASHQYNNQPDEIFNPPYAERWAGSSYVGTIEQTVTELPIGAYTVKVAAFRDQLITGASDQDAVYVFGNDAETLVSHATPTMYTVENILTYDGKITLGIKSKVANYKWMGIDNVSLLYVGKTLAFCDEALQQAITKAETVKETLNTAVKETFAQKIAIAKAAKADANRTIASVEEAAAELVEATDLANNIAQAYAKVNALVSTCNGYATNSTPAATGDLTTFNNAITEATADKETVATVDALNAVYNELETARQTYALKAYPTGDVTFDMTFNVVNPTFTVNTDGWTVNTGKWHNNSGYDGISGIAEIANWGANSWNASISQNVSLPNGKYKVKVAAQASAASTELKLTANEVPTSLTCIGDKGGNIAKDGSVVEMGNGVAGWQYIEVECLVINGTLAIAANSSATAQHCWANVDNFTLTLLRDLTDEERYEKKEANINISAGNKLATCVLPFDAELPVGVNAYTAGTLANNTLMLVAATTLKAFTPYILYAENGYTGTLTGDMDKTAYKAVVNGTLAGAVETQTITTGYALQNQGEGVKFYAVDTEKSQKVTIPAGKCWLDVVKGSTPAATTRSINLSFPGDETTGMKAMEIPVLIENGEIYTIDGKRVETMQSGKIYIIGGQKVIKK